MHEAHSLSVSLQKQPLLVFTMCGGGKDTSKLSFSWGWGGTASQLTADRQTEPLLV